MTDRNEPKVNSVEPENRLAEMVEAAYDSSGRGETFHPDLCRLADDGCPNFESSDEAITTICN